MNSNYQNVTWVDIERLVKLLSKKVLAISNDFASISTISREGLVPARLLADHMGLDTILVDKNKIPANSLFVDDIYDSGITFKKILPKITDLSNFVYAILFARKSKKYPKHLCILKKQKEMNTLYFRGIRWSTNN